jgi:hypothetical protein
VRERKAYIVLVLISILCSVIAVYVNIVHDNITRHDFCDVVQSITQRSVSKPANPALNPSRELNYEEYLRFVVLGQRLGC